MERGLIIALVAHQRFKLAGFPAPLHRVVRRVERHGVAMQMRIGKRNAVLGDGAGRAVDEFRPDHVAGVRSSSRAFGAHPHLHLVFHLLHGFLDRVAEHGFNPWVVAQFVGERDRLGSVEGEIVEIPACRPWCAA